MLMRSHLLLLTPSETLRICRSLLVCWLWDLFGVLGILRDFCDKVHHVLRHYGGISSQPIFQVLRNRDPLLQPRLDVPILAHTFIWTLECEEKVKLSGSEVQIACSMPQFGCCWGLGFFKLIKLMLRLRQVCILSVQTWCPEDGENDYLIVARFCQGCSWQGMAKPSSAFAGGQCLSALVW